MPRMTVTEVTESQSPGFLKRTPERKATLWSQEGELKVSVPEGVKLEVHQAVDVNVDWPVDKSKRIPRGVITNAPASKPAPAPKPVKLPLTRKVQP